MLADFFSRLKVLVIGDIMLDVYLIASSHRPCNEFPVEYQTSGPFTFSGIEEKPRLGGAANCAACCAALGADTYLFGFIGDDNAGVVVRTLIGETPNLSLFKEVKSPGLGTTTKLRILSGSTMVGRLDYDHTLKAEVQLNLADLLGFDAVILSDYNKGMIDCLMPSWCSLGRCVTHNSPPLVLGNIKPNHVEDLCSHLHILLLNLAEYLAIGRGSEEKAGETLAKLDVMMTVVTKGSAGAYLLDVEKTKVTHVPICSHPRISAIDHHKNCAGAGDSVAASITLGYLKSSDLETAVNFSQQIAALSIYQEFDAPVSIKEWEKYFSDGE